VNLTWVMFRAQDFPTAWRLLGAMTGLATGDQAVLPRINVIIVAVVIPVMLLVHWLMRERELEAVVTSLPWWATATAWAGMLFTIVATQGSGDAFIYFQF
jgi:alginate O-acetyltransferase complex protein AlgI